MPASPDDAFTADALPTGPALIGRALALNLSLTRLAQEIKVNKHTLFKLKSSDGGVRHDTIRRLNRAVIGHERAQLARLFRLHRHWLLSDNEARDTLQWPARAS